MTQLMASNGAVVLKTKELCQTILDHPEFKALQNQVQAFMDHEESRKQYQTVSELGTALRGKQQEGGELTPDEIEDFEKQREALLKNPVAAGFLDAQESIHDLKKLVVQHVSKTLELGRLPGEEDMQEDGCCSSGGCGGGCH
jgi:cell fate (sporulation/competence/biofilm development) regulator YlbF (YheA/YmcA/DUF963 family)